MESGYAYCPPVSLWTVMGRSGGVIRETKKVCVMIIIVTDTIVTVVDTICIVLVTMTCYMSFFLVGIFIISIFFIIFIIFVLSYIFIYFISQM